VNNQDYRYRAASPVTQTKRKIIGVTLGGGHLPWTF